MPTGPADPRGVANASDHYSDGEPMEKIPTPPSNLLPADRMQIRACRMHPRMLLSFFLSLPAFSFSLSPRCSLHQPRSSLPFFRSFLSPEQIFIRAGIYQPRSDPLRPDRWAWPGTRETCAGPLAFWPADALETSFGRNTGLIWTLWIQRCEPSTLHVDSTLQPCGRVVDLVGTPRND